MSKKLLWGALLAFAGSVARAAFIPISITSGFNQDVVVDGVGTATSRITADVDGANYAFVANGWQLTSTSTALSYGLPASGTLTSAITSGLTYQLAAYTASNSLRLSTNSTNGTLVFQNQTYKAQTVFILETSGSGASVFSAQVNFTDGTNQQFTGVNALDWFNNTPFAVGSIGRINTTNNNPENPTGGPRLYQAELAISAANQSKMIASVQITKTSGTGILNVMAVSIQEPVSYTPVEVLSGLNADVIANGTGTALATTTNDVDGADWCYMAIGWQSSSTVTPVTTGLPANGILTSPVTSTSGLTFLMAPWATPYTGNNSLRIPVNGNSGTLTLVNNPKAQAVYLAATSGSGPSNITGQINFADGTNQAIASTAVPDWYGGTPLIVSGIGRVGRVIGNIETPSGNPRVYQLSIPVSTANQNKPITSIQITKATTSATGAVVNVFATSVALTSPVTCAAPTAPVVSAITPNSANLGWTYTGTPLQWQIKYGAPGFNPNTAGTLATTTAAPPYTIGGLSPVTTYEVYVRRVCAAGDTSFWAPMRSFTTTCNAPAVVSYADSFVCGSGAVTLKATTVSGADIKWYSTATGGTALATGNTYTTPSLTASATYYISAASGSCESSPRQAVQAQVRAVPTVNLGNDTTLCPGVSYVLDATTANASYAWNTGASTATITVNTAGTYSVLVTVNGCSGSDARVITNGIVPVNNMPATTNLCEGDIATLNAGNSGSSYVWTPGANTTQTIDVNSGGTYSVQIRSIHGCVITSSTNVVMRPLPVDALGNDTSICEGSQITLDAGNAGYRFLWNTGDTTQTLLVSDSGLYAVTVTTPYGCFNEEERHVAFYPGPRVEGFNFVPLFYEEIGKVRFSPLNPTDVVSFEWDFGDGSPLSVQVNPTHVYTVAGDHIVTLTVYNGCSSYTVSLPIHVDIATGIVTLGRNEADVVLYPNPSRDLITIDNRSAGLKMQELTVFNALGAVVYRASAAQATQHHLNVQGMAAGLYSLRILTDKGFVTRKFEVRR